MIGRIVRHELRSAWRDGRILTVVVLTLGLLAVAVIVGATNVRALQAQREEAAALERANWLEQGPKNPHGAAHFGQYAFKPISGLALFDRGVDRYLGSAVWLEAHRQNTLVHRPADDAPAVQRFGDLTAANILQVIGPLLALLLTFAAIAGERERGTLRLLVSQGVRPQALVLGKLAAAMLVLAPLLLVALLSAAALAGANGLPYVGLLALGYGLYLGCFAALNLAISARARTSSAALVGSLALWVAAVVAVPRIASDIAAWACPTPSEHDFFAQVARDIKQGINGHDPKDSRTEALKAELLARYDVKTVEQLPVNFAGVALQAGEEYGDRVYDRRYGELYAIYRRQADLRLALALLSPRLALQPLSAALCGTDLAAHREFAAAAEEHRRALVRRLNEDVTQHPGASPFKYLAGPELWRELGELRRDDADPSPADLRGLAILAALFLLATSLALASARRLHVDP
ncbi:DUF3526 domain-containing protein [Nannocystis punicea]|uniref:DUF3526 domain-containing protein n=1 Tax=Nannocystis punicea TaxID=2995304 RepID=A0ABY7GYB1_9BACT|nr:DUF3526 domain-containing protein [Nannocystis poenicansa]WAS91864.1 DUF3526 domain-containing protein [Nannocystis poenicansa]